jgi:tetratricopeptide (TPR) repeat protein
MAVQPATKITELLEQANALLHQEVRDEVAIRRLEQEAKRLANADPVASHAFRGMLAALKRDPIAMREHFRVALSVAPGDVNVARNYSVCLNNLGYFSEAREMATKAYELRRGDLDNLDRLIRFSFASCRFDLAVEWLAEWAKLSPKEPHTVETDGRQIHAFLEAGHVEAQDLERLLQLTMSVLHDAGIYDVAGTPRILEDDESAWLSIWISIDQPVERVLELNLALVSRLVSEYPALAALPEATFQYVPAA